jgi:hypothetical protein
MEKKNPDKPATRNRKTNPTHSNMKPSFHITISNMLNRARVAIAIRPIARSIKTEAVTLAFDPTREDTRKIRYKSPVTPVGRKSARKFPII